VGIESYLGNGDKLLALKELRTILAKEIYITCINSGFDPESFNVDNYISQTIDNPEISIGPERILLLQLCNKFSLVESKIKELE
jgi:hypothetical protein